ncbi:MAG: hypothetical protein G8237_01955 [Magnetococcales bacterium]|nr:hypothetical protein [Magnetococcales bacterium]NGZ05098.1 hypothetical protein [Magnetococcales bacterium]
MELTSGARVAVVGGGPSGSLSAYFLLDLARQTGITLQLDLFEPRDFTQTGPPGCNMCGGVISESLMQKMAAEGIVLPKELLLDAIDSYVLHTDSGAATIHPFHAEMRIASIFRGAGPLGAESQHPLPWSSFDQHLLEMARQSGANVLRRRVRHLDRTPEGHPRVFLHPAKGDSSDSTEPFGTYDLLIGCVGLNGSGVRMFEEMRFGYRPPRNDRAWVGELYMGAKEVHRRLGHAMHIFLLDIPGMKFAAMTPKGHYATFIILGHGVNEEVVKRVFQSPRVRSLFPEGWETPVRPCHCQPRINLGPPVNPFADRVVLVGDCATSRLYKDGIGAAYRMAKACAFTAITRGISAQAFREGYWPVCRQMDRDNALGHLLFSMDGIMRYFSPLRRAMITVIREEQSRPQDPRRLSSAMWDTFTGSAPYRQIFQQAFHPVILWRLFVAMLRALVPGQQTDAIVSTTIRE